LPVFIIIKGQQIIETWFDNNFYKETTIITSKSGYSNNEIGLKILEYFIKYTKLAPWVSLISPTVPKLLLYNRYIFYCTDEFKALALQNNIILYQFLSYLTYILQPLDIGCFQTWKHFYNLAIYKSLYNLQNSYNSAVFLRDLEAIRIRTLTIPTIVSVFQKSGVWPSEIEVIFKKIRKYSIARPSSTKVPDSDSELPVYSLSKSILKTTPSVVGK
jgi:hypothetical protein